MTDSVGRRFVDAVAAKDAAALTALIADKVDFKGLTPGRFWEASTPAQVVDVVLGHWFGETDHVTDVAWVEDGEPVGDTQRVGYRLMVTNAGGPHLVEQQVYYREHSGQVSYARVVCSGYRPAV